MSSSEGRPATPLGDDIALRLQALRHRSAPGPERSLLRVDNREETAQAPYQFDTVQGRLHRRGCRSIPRSSRTALYGVWRIRPEQRGQACPHCRPQPTESPAPDEPSSTDLLYGLLSIVDQFGGVLRERGRDFRRSQRARGLGGDLKGLYETFGRREREVLDVVATALDGIVETIRGLEEQLDGNGAGKATDTPDNGNGRGK